MHQCQQSAVSPAWRAAHLVALAALTPRALQRCALPTCILRSAAGPAHCILQCESYRGMSHVLLRPHVSSVPSRSQLVARLEHVGLEAIAAVHAIPVAPRPDVVAVHGRPHSALEPAVWWNLLHTVQKWPYEGLLLLRRLSMSAWSVDDMMACKDGRRSESTCNPYYANLECLEDLWSIVGSGRQVCGACTGQ